MVRTRVVFADSAPSLESYDAVEEAAEYDHGAFTYRGMPYRLRWLSGGEEVPRTPQTLPTGRETPLPNRVRGLSLLFIHIGLGRNGWKI